MSNVLQALAEGKPFKALIYGYGKTRKTTWAGLLAKTQMNLIYCDCDNSVPVLGSVLTPEEQARLAYLDVSDSATTANAGWFLSALSKGKPFIWDETDRKVARGYVQGHRLALINPKLFTPSDCLIFDSYTQFCNSLFMQYAIENNIDMTEAKKLEWDDYRWAGQLATRVLTSLVALPCSVILISHVRTYEKRRKNKFGQEEVVSCRTQPISVSNNHAETISKFFGEVYYFYKAGTATMISTKTTDSLDCGSRFLPAKEWRFEELTAESVANNYRVNKPSELKAFAALDESATEEDFNKIWNEMRGITGSASSASSATTQSASKPQAANKVIMPMASLGKKI